MKTVDYFCSILEWLLNGHLVEFRAAVKKLNKLEIIGLIQTARGQYKIPVDDILAQIRHALVAGK